MKITYQVTERTTVEFECTDQEDYLKKRHMIEEVMLEDTCGKCHKKNIVAQVRTKDKYTYNELRCKDCGHTLQFGKTDSGLYPRRKEMDGTKPKLKDGKPVWLPNRGWIKWDNDQGKYV